MQVEVIESRFDVLDKLGQRSLPYIEIKGGASPGIFNLSGFGANHFGGRARFLFDKCKTEKRNFVAFTNSGLDDPKLDPLTQRHIVRNFSMERWENEAVKLFTAKKGKGKWVVAANSLSTGFAERITRENQDCVEGVVLVAPATSIDQTLAAWFRVVPNDKAALEKDGYFDLPVHTVNLNGPKTFVRITEGEIDAAKKREIGTWEQIKFPCEVAILHDPKDPQVSMASVEDFASRIIMPGPARPKVTPGDNVSHVRAGHTDHKPMWDLIVPFLQVECPQARCG